MSEPLNLHDLAVEGDPADPEGYRCRMARFGPSIGAERLGGTVYELDPGDSVCPYHYEVGGLAVNVPDNSTGAATPARQRVEEVSAGPRSPSEHRARRSSRRCRPRPSRGSASLARSTG